MPFRLENILSNITVPFEVIGNINKSFSSIDPIFEATEHSLTWIRSDIANATHLVDITKSEIIICDKKIVLSKKLIGNKTLLLTEKPEILFIRIVKHLFGRQIKTKHHIHTSAIVSEKAKLGVNVSIGPFCIIDECEIGDNSVIEANAHIHDQVFIGKNVIVSEFCNLGGQGFGHIKNEFGELENMLHIGKVIIEDNVEIFPYCNVDRATLSETRIGEGSKIDHYCHIGHNSKIGKQTIITAHVTLCGGCSIGNHSWIGVNSVVKDKVRVGNFVTIGMGSNVTKDISDNEMWVGNPARPFTSYKK